MSKPDPIVCGLVAGPLIVVVAAIVTAVIAFNGADTPIGPAAARPEKVITAPALVPAMTGRNRAAEGAHK